VEAYIIAMTCPRPNCTEAAPHVHKDAAADAYPDYEAKLRRVHADAQHEREKCGVCKLLAEVERLREEIRFQPGQVIDSPSTKENQ
jgi:hypothetical protein